MQKHGDLQGIKKYALFDDSIGKYATYLKAQYSKNTSSSSHVSRFTNQNIVIMIVGLQRLLPLIFILFCANGQIAQSQDTLKNKSHKKHDFSHQQMLKSRKAEANFMRLATDESYNIIMRYRDSLPAISEKKDNIGKHNFKTIEDIEDYVFDIAQPNSIKTEILASFHKDPARQLFEGDDLDRYIYLKSDEYKKDYEYWQTIKKYPFAIIVNNIEVKDFNERGYTISARNYHQSNPIYRNFICFYNILFPFKAINKLNGNNDAWRVKGKSIESLLSIRSSAKNGKCEIVIIFNPGCYKEITHKYGLEKYYFAKVSKAFLLSEGEVIDDLTSYFAQYSPSVIEEAIRAEKIYRNKK